MDKDKVLGLAKLSRIKLSDDEATGLAHEFEAILNYVGEVKGVEKSKEGSSVSNALYNVLRNDEEVHESGLYTEKLLNEAPSRESNYFKVKKIL